MAEVPPIVGGEEEAGPKDAKVPLNAADRQRLTELVYNLLRDEINLTRERRGETVARWR